MVYNCYELYWYGTYLIKDLFVVDIISCLCIKLWTAGLKIKSISIYWSINKCTFVICYLSKDYIEALISNDFFLMNCVKLIFTCSVLNLIQFYFKNKINIKTMFSICRLDGVMIKKNNMDFIFKNFLMRDLFKVVINWRLSLAIFLIAGLLIKR